MTTTRRLLVLLTVTVAVVLGTGGTAANATFSDSATLAAMTVGTGTVAPATDVKVTASCTMTTRVITQYYRVDPVTGITTRYGWSESRWSETTKTNVESDTTTAPVWTSATEYNTTRTIQDTALYATLTWSPSPAGRVAAYRMTVHTALGNFAMGETGPTATSLTGHYDASATNWRPQLSIDTVTDYGWIGTSALSNVVRC